MDECINCERTDEELELLEIELDDGYCTECLEKIQKEWKAERKYLNSYWYSTRI